MWERINTLQCRLCDHHAWYSAWIMWIANGNYPSCQHTAHQLFAQWIDQSARKIRQYTLQREPVPYPVSFWTSHTGRRPLMMCVGWSPNCDSHHWLCYCDGFFYHSAMFHNLEKTKWCGFSLVRVAAPDRRPFDELAKNARLPCSLCSDCSGTELVRGLLRQIESVLEAIPGLLAFLGLRHLTGQLSFRELHRTRLPNEDVGFCPFTVQTRADGDD